MNTQTIGIVGGGLMGAGIAVKFALAGHDVRLLEISLARRGAVPAVLAAILGELRDATAIDETQAAAAVERVRLATALTELSATALVIEAIPEDLKAKQELYGQLEALLAPDAVIASNTSGLMPDALSAEMSRPERFLITHFWNPPHAIPLVEVVPASGTAPAHVDSVMRVLRAIGAEPVLLRKAVPGFVGNRIQFAIMREALHLIQTGVADAETIDTVVKTTLGRRYGIVGPLEAADLGGLDTFLRVATHLAPSLATDSAGLDVLRKLVERGETGAVAGRGFHSWTQERREIIRKKRIAQLAQSRGERS